MAYYPPNQTFGQVFSAVTGSSGQFLTSLSNGTTTWNTPNQNFVSNNGVPLMTIPSGESTVVLEEKATLDVKGTVKINGVDLEERLSTIETLLQIPTRDVTMEAKHPKLKALYEEYMHELEKYRTWHRIKGEDNGTT